MPHEPRSAGAIWMRVLPTIGLLLLLAVACGADGGSRPAEGQLAQGARGCRAAAVTEPTADEASGKQMTPSLRAAYLPARERSAGPDYEVMRKGAELAAYNPAQAFALWFGDRVELAPDRVEWSLGVDVKAFGCVGDMASVETAEPEIDEAQPNQVWHPPPKPTVVAPPDARDAPTRGVAGLLLVGLAAARRRRLEVQ